MLFQLSLGVFSQAVNGTGTGASCGCACGRMRTSCALLGGGCAQVLHQTHEFVRHPATATAPIYDPRTALRMRARAHDRRAGGRAGLTETHTSPRVIAHSDSSVKCQRHHRLARSHSIARDCPQVDRQRWIKWRKCRLENLKMEVPCWCVSSVFGRSARDSHTRHILIFECSHPSAPGNSPDSAPIEQVHGDTKSL